MKDQAQAAAFVDKLLSPLIDMEVTFGDLSIPATATHDTGVEVMQPIAKPVFRAVYDPLHRRCLTLLVTRKTSGTPRLPLTSVHENRQFRFVFVIRSRFDQVRGPSGESEDSVVVVQSAPFFIGSVEPADGCLRKKKPGEPTASGTFAPPSAPLVRYGRCEQSYHRVAPHAAARISPLLYDDMTMLVSPAAIAPMHLRWIVHTAGDVPSLHAATAPLPPSPPSPPRCSLGVTPRALRPASANTPTL